jgi:hypothetical protein
MINLYLLFFGIGAQSTDEIEPGQSTVEILD